MARSVRVAPLNVKKKKEVSKEVQALFALLAKRWKQAAFCAFGKLSAVFLFWRARRRSEVKGKFMEAVGTTVLSTFTWSLHVLQAACNPVTLSSSIRKSALHPKWSRISQRGCVTSTDPRLWAKCWIRKCKKNKKCVHFYCLLGSYTRVHLWRLYSCKYLYRPEKSEIP